MSVKNAIIKAKVENEIVELMVKSNVGNIYLDDGTTTLAAKLAELIASLNSKATTEEVSSSISTAINELIGGAPATYDTLKEIADYIAADKEVTDALNAAIGNKVDKVEGKGLSTNDLTDELLAKINSLDASNQHTHSNKSVLDGITSSDVSNWNGKTKVYVQAAQPESLADGDVFIQITE